MNEKLFMKLKETDYIFDDRTHDFIINDRKFSIHRCTDLIVFNILINLCFEIKTIFFLNNTNALYVILKYKIVNCFD